MSFDAPKDNLFRGFADGVRLEKHRAADDAAWGESDDGGSLLHGHFTPFDVWTRIESWFEGTFLERIAPGSFRKTIKENRDQIRVQFDHGFDAHVGESPLGPIDILREEDFGPYYEVPLLDTDYNRDRILPLLQGRTIDGRQLGSLLGASFRFRVTREEWAREPKPSTTNPEGLAERTIREVTLHEFGPVVFPAYPDATAKVRCLTDHFLDRQRERRSTNRHGTPPIEAPAVIDPVAPPELGHPMGAQGRLVASARTSTLSLLRRTQ